MDSQVKAALEDAGVQSLEDARAKGREWWLGFFADLEGFQFDFVEYLSSHGVTWEQAATHPPFETDIFEHEIGTASAMVIQDAGCQTMAEVFKTPLTTWREAMAKRTGVFGQLEISLAEGRSDPWST